MRRALVLAALVAPALAAAQVTAPAGAVIELGNFNPALSPATSYINAAQCAGGDMLLEWNIPAAQGGTYQVIGASEGPDETGFCPTVERPNADPPVYTAQLPGGSVAFTGSAQSKAFPGNAVFDAANPPTLSCESAAENSEVFVCVHWANGTQSGIATGRFLVQLATPARPTGVSVGSGDRKLTVRWTASSGGDAIADRYVARATPVGGGDTFSSALTNATTAEISGLQNGTEYAVRVFALSVGRNESDGTDPVNGIPQPTDDFWEVYRNTPGAREEGGCGTGGTGALALLGVSLAALVRRRK
jgi:uncharacterized protein (TIGR03382 family)